MSWFVKRSPEEKRRDKAESDYVQDKLKYVMSELRQCLDNVEDQLEKDLRNGGPANSS